MNMEDTKPKHTRPEHRRLEANFKRNRIRDSRRRLIGKTSTEAATQRLSTTNHAKPNNNRKKLHWSVRNCRLGSGEDSVRNVINILLFELFKVHFHYLHFMQIMRVFRFPEYGMSRLGNKLNLVGKLI